MRVSLLVLLLFHAHDSGEKAGEMAVLGVIEPAEAFNALVKVDVVFSAEGLRRVVVAQRARIKMNLVVFIIRKFSNLLRQQSVG